jgi:hypothetical protein
MLMEFSNIFFLIKMLNIFLSLIFYLMYVKYNVRIISEDLFIYY